MKKKLTFLTIAAFVLFAFLTIPMGVWGQTRSEVVAYTLDGTITATGNAYATATELTQNDITWMVTANTEMSPWRIGGKSISGVDRPMYSTTPIADNITKIEVTHGTASGITVNSWTVIVASDASFTNVVSTLTPTFTASATTTINRPTGADWTDCYYKFIYNVTVSQSSNKFVQFVEADFYKQEGSGPVIATPTFDPVGGSYTTTQNVTISCETQGSTIYYTTDGNTPNNNSTQYNGAITVSETTTINAIAYVGNDASSVATATYTIVSLEHAGTEADPYSVADARTAIDANVGVTGVYATGIVSAIPTAWSTDFNNITFNFVDNVGDNNFLQAYRCVSGTGVDASQVAVGDVVVVYGNLTKYGSTYEFGQGCTLVSLTHPTSTEPSITVTPATLNVDAQEHLVNYLDLAYENIDVENGSSFTVHYYNAEGEEIQVVPGEAWMIAGVVKPNDVYQVLCVIVANEGEARTAYFKLSALDAENNTVYSNLVTVNQEAPELPHVTWDLSTASYDEITDPDIVTWSSEYATMTNSSKSGGTSASNYLGGDSNNRTSSRFYNGNTLTMSPAAGYAITSVVFTATSTNYANALVSSTWTNATASADGTTVTVTPTDGATAMVATIGGTCGFTSVTVYYEENTAPAVPSITITPDSFELDANSHMGEVLAPIAYQNIVVVSGSGTESFDVQYYDAEGQEIEQTWCSVGAAANGDTDFNLIIAAGVNEGNEARTAYFKLYGLDEEANLVYSNLVTINQAGAPQQYTLTVEPFENLDLITFVNDEMVMEGDGEIQVTEGDEIMLSIVALEGYVMETLMVNGVDHVNDIADDFTYSFEMPAENVTISATAVEDVPQTPGEWVMVSLNDLTENDEFVIVGVYDEDESSFAMANNSTNAPSAVDVMMVGNTLSGDIAENLKWNLSIGEDGYTFYPNGETESWLFCNRTNNGVRVGTNENNVFTMTPEGYLFNNATSRYIGIYNRQDWRCYTSINNNIKDQTFAFYKRVDEGSLVTHTLDIEGYGDNDNPGGWYLIASPVSMIRPTFENGFITEAYDLYYFDQAQNDFEWRNYKAKHFNIVSGKGYLYASQENTTLTFTGIPYEGNGEVALDYTEDVTFQGWNLIGNPFDVPAYFADGRDDFYEMNGNGTGFTMASTAEIAPMQGIFVPVTADEESVMFVTERPESTGKAVTLRLGNNSSSNIDAVRVRFEGGRAMGKLMLNENATKLYIPQNGEDYSVVTAETEGQMPVNFKAAANGTYTLNVEIKNVKLSYLHLIDNLTGTNVDLMANPSYSFNATTSDYATRFSLVFAENTGVGENNDAPFAFISNGNIIVNGEGVLEMIDMTGRIIVSRVHTVSTKGMASGVYMLRLTNGNAVKTQKIVVE